MWVCPDLGGILQLKNPVGAGSLRPVHLTLSCAHRSPGDLVNLQILNVVPSDAQCQRLHFGHHIERRPIEPENQQLQPMTGTQCLQCSCLPYDLPCHQQLSTSISPILVSSSNLNLTAGQQIFVVHRLGTHFKDGQCRGTKKYKVQYPLLQCLKQVRIGVWIHIPSERKANATRRQVQTQCYRCALTCLEQGRR